MSRHVNYDHRAYETFDLATMYDILDLFMGRHQGSGITRDVFNLCACNYKAVIKIESADAVRFQNTIEWELWEEARYTKWEKWLAPCLAISHRGAALIQAKTSPVTADQMPERLPSFLSDLKLSNFGLLEGRVVAHDYGLSSGLWYGMSKAKMVRVPKKRWT